MNILSYIITNGDFPSFIMWAVGVLVCCGIAWFIVQQLALPPVALKVVYIVGALILLLMALDFFFGSPHAVIVR